MATIDAAITQVQTVYGHVHAASWTPLTEADVASPVSLTVAADRSVQIEGTFGSATGTIQGSNDGVNYHTLSDPQGNALSLTSAALKQISELTRYIKPVFSGGTGQSVTVTLIVRGAL